MAQAAPFHHYVARFSELAKAADPDGLLTTLTLEMAGVSAKSCALAVDLDFPAGLKVGIPYHPCILQAADAIARLRLGVLPEHAGHKVPISSSIWFDWDASAGQVELSLAVVSGLLFRADIRVTGTPHFLNLHIGMGHGSFAPGDTFGLALDIRAQGLTNTPPATSAVIRSFKQRDWQDTFLDDPFLLNPVSAPGILVHTVGLNDPLCWRHEDHVLILPLPVQAMTMDLADLRLFYLPAEEGNG